MDADFTDTLKKQGCLSCVPGSLLAPAQTPRAPYMVFLYKGTVFLETLDLSYLASLYQNVLVQGSVLLESYCGKLTR